MRARRGLRLVLACAGAVVLIFIPVSIPNPSRHQPPSTSTSTSTSISVRPVLRFSGTVVVLGLVEDGKNFQSQNVASLDVRTVYAWYVVRGVCHWWLTDRPSPSRLKWE